MCLATRNPLSALSRESADDVWKQLFDIAALFDVATDFAGVADTYDLIFAAENGYRAGRFSRDEALNDTIDTARCYSTYGLKGAPQHPHQGLLESGRRALTSHLIGATFTGAEAKVAAAKAACLAAALRDGNPYRLFDAGRYTPEHIPRLASVKLADPVLQRLRGGNPEAFYYWSLALAQALEHVRNASGHYYQITR
jgi:hypothetical protein